jgi:hypothetical protein
MGKKRKPGEAEKARKGGNLRAPLPVGAQLPLVPAEAPGAIARSGGAACAGRWGCRRVKRYG